MFIEMFFISSLKLLCRSCSVSELIALFNAAMLSPNMLMLLKEHGVNKNFNTRGSTSTSPW